MKCNSCGRQVSSRQIEGDGCVFCNDEKLTKDQPQRDLSTKGEIHSNHSAVPSFDDSKVKNTSDKRRKVNRI